MYNICLNNISGQAKMAVETVGVIKNITISNVFLNAPDSVAVSNVNIPTTVDGMHITNVFNNSPDENSAAAVFKDCKVNDLVMNGIMPGLKTINE